MICRAMSCAQKRLVLFAIVFCVAMPACNSKTDLTTTPGTESGQEKVESQGGIADTIRSQRDHNDVLVETEPLPENLQDLMSYLAQKQAEQLRPRDESEGYRIQKQRAAASEKLLEMEINGEQRFEFVKIRIDALLKLLGAGDPTAKQELKEVISKYGEHRHVKTRQTVAIGGLLLDFREAIASVDQPGTSPDLSPVISAATKVVADYPDSFDVCKEIGNMSDQLLQTGHRQAWSEFAQVLVNGYRDSSNATCRKYTERLSGQLQVASANLDVIVDQIHKRESGAIEEYRKAINFLFSDPQISLSSLQPIVGSLAWLEATGMQRETLEANRIVMAASMNIADSNVRDHLRASCEKRDARIELIGKPLLISGLMADQEQLDWNTLSKDHPVIVVFWSPAEPASVKLVETMAGYFEQHKHQGLKLLAVNLASDSDLSNLFSDTPQPREWVIATSNAESGEASGLFDQFGISNVPQLVLVNNKGIVTAVNPTPAQLSSRLDELTQ